MGDKDVLILLEDPGLTHIPLWNEHLCMAKWALDNVFLDLSHLDIQNVILLSCFTQKKLRLKVMALKVTVTLDPSSYIVGSLIL